MKKLGQEEEQKKKAGLRGKAGHGTLGGAEAGSFSGVYSYLVEIEMSRSRNLHRRMNRMKSRSRPRES